MQKNPSTEILLPSTVRETDYFDWLKMHAKNIKAQRNKMKYDKILRQDSQGGKKQQ